MLPKGQNTIHLLVGRLSVVEAYGKGASQQEEKDEDNHKLNRSLPMDIIKQTNTPWIV